MKSSSARFSTLESLSTFGKDQHYKVANVDSKKALQNGREAPRKHTLTKDFLCWVWPSNVNPPITLCEMNVMETSVWILNIAGLKGWEEARRYSQSFKNYNITGDLLSCLNTQTLRNELEIAKLGHRLEIIEAIEMNQLTVMNPTIVAIDLNMSFFFGKFP